MNKRLVSAAAGVTVALAAAIPGGAAFARKQPPKPPPTRTPGQLAALCSSELATYNALEAQEASDTTSGDTASVFVDEALARSVASKYSANGCVAVTGALPADTV